MNETQGPPANHRSIFWISVLALFIAALAASIRNGVTASMEAQFFTSIDPQHSTEMIGQVMGMAFRGFAFSLLIISPLLDWIGAKRVVLFAAACFILGPVIVLAAPSVEGSPMTVLSAAMLLWGFGWGATEASINPMTAAMYPTEKTGKLNSLHAWWPFGIIVGGLLSTFFSGVSAIGWQGLVGLAAVPGVVLAIWAIRHDFPQTESKAAGVPT
jgi:MFS family permease